MNHAPITSNTTRTSQPAPIAAIGRHPLHGILGSGSVERAGTPPSTGDAVAGGQVP